MPLEFDEAKLPRLKLPDRDTTVTRYLDLPKFLSLISTKSLFFTRLDLMEDKYEGRMMEQSYKTIVNDVLYHHQRGYFNPSSESPEQMAIKSADGIKHFVNVARKTNLINCWSKHTAESYALWKIFAKTDTGIMVKSSINNVIKIFEKESKKLWASEIIYLKEGEGVTHPGNTAQYVIHKNIAYKYEEEIRIIYDISIGENIHPEKFNWDERENPNGISINIDPNILIDEIILGPDCQPWFYDIIISVCEKYGINKPVRISDLKYKES